MPKWFELIGKIFPKEAKIIIFDNEDRTSVVHHKFAPKKIVEIDGVILYENIIFLINGFSGDGSSNFEQKHKFFSEMKDIKDPTKLNLIVMGKGSKLKENLKKIEEFKNELDKRKKYKFYLKKIVFAPNARAENASLWTNIGEDDFLIDKILFKYLNYCCTQIEEAYGFRELLIMLKIKKSQIKRLVSDEGLGLPLDGGHAAIFSQIENDKRVLYSFVVSVREIIDCIKVLRFECVPEGTRAFQRIVDRDRLKNISDYYLYKHQSFPTNVILAFNPEVYTKDTRKRVIDKSDDNRNSADIFLLQEFGSLIVIDGQHRILSHLKNPSRDMDKKILVSILDFTDLDEIKTHEEMTRTFVEINNYHRKLSAMIKLRIDALNEPDKPFSRWYNIFKSLNKKESKSYFSDMIEFEDTPLKRFEPDKKKRINISSLVKYAGVAGLEKGNKQYKGLLDEGFFTKDQLEELIKNYFEIIKEITQGSKSKESIILSPRDIGGLMRLMVHFRNDKKTKDLFIKLNTLEGKAGIKPYLETIEFDKLKDLSLGPNTWAIMEGNFLAQINIKYPKFGVRGKLTEKGLKEMKRILRIHKFSHRK